MPNDELSDLENSVCNPNSESDLLGHQKQMIPIIERPYLQELRDTAKGMGAGNLNPDWVKAYDALADAADRLDAMEARSTVPPAGGWKEGTPVPRLARNHTSQTPLE